MIFRKIAEEKKQEEKPSKKPKWGSQGAGMQQDSKQDSKSDAGPKGNNEKETMDLEKFKQNNEWAAGTFNQLFILEKEKDKAEAILGAVKDKLDKDKDQCQIVQFVPKYMTACEIADLSNDITKNVSIEQVGADYQDYKKFFQDYIQKSKSILDFWPDIERATEAALSQGVTKEALSEYEGKFAKIQADINKNIYAYNGTTRQMDILLSAGPSGRSILDCYQEIIDLGAQGCKICQDASSSFNTMKGLGPVTAYVTQLISIYSQIANIYQRELGPTFSLIAANSGSSASRAKIQNTVELISTRIPQAYANEILKAKYALMIGKTYGFDNQTVRNNLETFLSAKGGASGAMSAPSSFATPQKGK